MPSQHELLGDASLSITDQSSVWVVFLLTEHPFVFGINNLEEHMRNREYYFAPVRNADGSSSEGVAQLVVRVLAGDPR